MDFVTALTTLNETLKVSKGLLNITHEMDKAELKLRFAEVVDGILEAKNSLVDAQQNERELLLEIASLKKKLNERGNLEDEDGLLFELDENGKRSDRPYCNYCYVKEDKLFRVRRSQSGYSYQYNCDNCNKGLGVHRGNPTRKGGKYI
ncbi:hypothetical protein GCM10011498_14020 [Amylibacter cionae]|uniref:Uncharacterized protein n=2 Tax=Neptunicoccus cionae TaxID=2035344 RepID=A0A916QUX4_9RHOB|nr:hypothetical protein GCM10011498_14020 [Amylibacter cionae]